MKKNYWNCLNSVMLLILLTTIGCGRKKPPTGGPVDTESPCIISFSPENYATNFTGNNLKIIFSKEIDKSSFLSAYNIYPPMGKIKLKWKRNSVIIEPNENFIQNTNYFVTINKRCKDIHNNKLANIYTYIFSTQAKLPNNSIKVAIDSIAQSTLSRGNVYVSLFDEDTLLVMSKEINEFSQAEFSCLNLGTYLITGFQDLNDDFLYNFDNEPYAKNKVNLNSHIVSVSLYMSLADTTKPHLKAIKTLHKNSIELLFTEPVKISDNFSDKIKIVQAEDIENTLAVKDYLSVKDKIILITEDQDSVKYKLYMTEIMDEKGNITKQDSLIFIGNSHIDRTPLSIIFCYPPDGSTVNTLLPDIVIKFDRLLPSKNVVAYLVNSEDNRKISVNIYRIAGNEYRFSPKKKLRNYVPYAFILDEKTEDYNGNNLAKMFKISILPISKDEYKE